MLEFPGHIKNGETLRFDICVVGAGATGITLGLELNEANYRVCILEAGSLRPPPLGEDHPYNGEIAARDYPLATTRLRYFGGTTNHWGGWCRPLDPLDFKKRKGVPFSGWPLSRQMLEPYYRRAAGICEIDPPDFDLKSLTGEDSRNYFDGGKNHDDTTSTARRCARGVVVV